jgi:hypothetical protein
VDDRDTLIAEVRARIETMLNARRRAAELTTFAQGYGGPPKP